MAQEMGPGKTIVTILCDYGNRYASKIFNPDFLHGKGLPVPRWHHHALLLDADGGKLAKRRGSPGLDERRLAGEDGWVLADNLRAGRFPAGISLGQS